MIKITAIFDNKIASPDSPEVFAKKYLLKYKENLSKRRECLNGAIPWYSLQWARDIKQLDTTPKIMVQNTRNERLRPRIVATVDEIGVYGSQGMNFIVPKSVEENLTSPDGISAIPTEAPSNVCP